MYNLVNAPLTVPVRSRLCHLLEAHWLTVQTLSRANAITVSKSCDSYLFGISCIKCLGGRKSRSSIDVCMMLMPTFVLIQVVHSPGVEWEGSQEGFASSYHQSGVFLLIVQRGKTGGGSHQEMGEHLREARTSIRFLKL